MDDFDRNDNQTSTGSGGNSATGATGTGSVLDAFKGAGQGTQGAAQTATDGKPETATGSTQEKQAHTELKAWGAQLSKELKENKDAVKALAKFEDISGLANSYLELQGIHDDTTSMNKFIKVMSNDVSDIKRKIKDM